LVHLSYHTPIPVQKFPGLSHNVIEHHEAQHYWHQHHPLHFLQPVPTIPIPIPAFSTFGHIPAPAPYYSMASVEACTLNNLEAHRAARHRHNNYQPSADPNISDECLQEIRNDLLERQAQETLHQQWIQ
jgi:hypothetical protein